jgi:hypothetical protein
MAWAWFLPPSGTFHIDQLADMLNLLTFAGVNVLIVAGFSIARRQLVKEAPHEEGTFKGAHSGFVKVFQSSQTQAGQPYIAKSRHTYRNPRLALAVLGLVAIFLGVFGSWGTFTTAGSAYFDDEAWLVPLFCLAMAPAILIFAIGFLPVHSIDRDAAMELSNRPGC